MRNRPAIAELLAFARGYRNVCAMLAAGHYARELPRSDPLLAAYDFRPSVRHPRPSLAMSLKALKTAGFDRSAGYDPKLFIEDNIAVLTYAYLRETGIRIEHEEMRHIITAFKHYLDLKEGRITRWKMLKNSPNAFYKAI